MAPVVDAGRGGFLGIGDTFSERGSFTDPGDDKWTATVDYGYRSGIRLLELNDDKTFTLAHTYTTSGRYVVTVTIADDDRQSGSDSIIVSVS